MKLTEPSPAAVIAPVVKSIVAFELFAVVYVIAPSLFDVGAVIIFTGESSYVIETGTAKVADDKLLVARMTVITKLYVREL